MKEKHSFVINGISSLSLIFAVLCTGILCLLSLGHSRIDYALCQDTLSNTLQYYEAVSSSSIVLDKIDEALEETFKNASSEEAYFSSLSFSALLPEQEYTYDRKEHLLSWNTSISEKKNLFIQIQILYPKTTGDTYYQILSYITKPAKDWTPEIKQPLYLGGKTND